MAQRQYLTPARQARIEQLLKEHNVPGASVAVVYGGDVETEVRGYAQRSAQHLANILIVKGYGLARLSPNTPATSNTLFHIGSLTKAMTAAAAGKVFDIRPEDSNPASRKSTVLEKLRKDKFATRIQSLLPDFVLEDDYISREATIEDALSHRTGMAGADKVYGDWMGSDPAALVRGLRYLGRPTMGFRSGWQYNNIMYSVVGAVLQEAVGKAWGDVLRDLLWRPLGMDSTVAYSVEVKKEDEARMACGYCWDDSDGEAANGKFLEEPFLAFAGIGPAGSTVSTAEDLAKWMQAMLAGAGGDTDSLISSKLFQELATPRMFHNTDPMPSMLGYKNGFFGMKSYSLGWFNMPNSQGPRHPVLCHGGGLTGFGAMMYLLPNDNFGCVVLGNTMDTANVVGEIVCLELLADGLELEGQSRLDFIDSLQTVSSDIVLALSRSTQDQVRAEQLRVDATPGHHQQLAEELSGTYSHPVYGSYQVTSLTSSDESTKIVYGAQLSADIQRERSTSRATKGLLLVQPLGHRTWREMYVLHLRTDLQDSDQPEVVYLDLEQLLARGKGPSASLLANGDSHRVPGLDFAAANVWQSNALSQNGAVVELKKDGNGHHSLGLRLGNAHLVTNGSGGQDSWAEMVWLTEEVESRSGKVFPAS